jgi:hypothetical protein
LRDRKYLSGAVTEDTSTAVDGQDEAKSTMWPRVVMTIDPCGATADNIKVV